MKEYKNLSNISKDLEEKLATINRWFEKFLKKNSRYISEELPVDYPVKIVYNNIIICLYLIVIFLHNIINNIYLI